MGADRGDPSKPWVFATLICADRLNNRRLLWTGCAAEA